jgi:hypothetical protein
MIQRYSFRAAIFLILATGVSFDQTHQHSHDSLEIILAGSDLIARESSFGRQNIQTRRTFQRRPVGGVKETTAVL